MKGSEFEAKGPPLSPPLKWGVPGNLDSDFIKDLPSSYEGNRTWNRSVLWRNLLVSVWVLFTISCSSKNYNPVRSVQEFNNDWQFTLDEIKDIYHINDPEINWRTLNLPHDWSIEGEFSPDHPAGVGGGALPGGTGWYKKNFFIEESDSSKLTAIRFDGVYMNSEVWINGKYLGKRPNGYIGFSYNLSEYLLFGEDNQIVVKVDNSQQPNSRWYSGSGIYRNVWLIKTNKVHVAENGTYVTTPEISESEVKVSVETTLENSSDNTKAGVLVNEVVRKGDILSNVEYEFTLGPEQKIEVQQFLKIPDPKLWSVRDPELYEVQTYIEIDGRKVDSYKTSFGIRSFEFDLDKGFILNGEQVKIKGVNNHHDLGALGAAVNKRAIERQLEILKDMGVNAIRTSHNPPAPELLELTDKMGFIVMDEAFDVWKRSKVEFDYGIYWDEWHERDLRDFIKRDRNHPSVIIWSIGNEILEQWGDPAGTTIAKELREIVRSLDTTRVITDGMNPPGPGNTIASSGVLDVIGYNYHHEMYPDHYGQYPNTPMIGTETTSALATRGSYDIYLPSDSIRRWPVRWDILFEDGNPGNTVSAYDHVSAPWGSTHEETWKVVKKHDFISGMFIWTGFDYIGEPTPYVWPSRSSYFGVVDLAGFPKDSYYMYQSEWTDKEVLHIFPHWNWSPGDTVDIWAYYNHADEVELFLNGESLGIISKEGDDMHVSWRVPFTPGTLKAISRKSGSVVQTKEIHTAGAPGQIRLESDREVITADGKDLSFVTVSVLDNDGNLVPKASNRVKFEVEGPGFIAGVDNGDQTSHESFKSNQREVFNGLALVIIQSSGEQGPIKLRAVSEGLVSAEITIRTK